MNPFWADTAAFDRITIRNSDVSVSGVINAISLDSFNSTGNQIRNIIIERCKIRKSGNGHILKFVGFLKTSAGYSYFNNIHILNNIFLSGSITINLDTIINWYTTRTQLDAVVFENNTVSAGKIERYINNNDCIGLSTLTIKNNIFINGTWSGYVSVFSHGSNPNSNIQDARIENCIFYAVNHQDCDNCIYLNNLVFGNGTNDTLTSTNTFSGNIIGDPLFVNYSGGAFNFIQDFNLNPGSPGIGAGTPGNTIGNTGGSFPYAVGEGQRIPLITSNNLSNVYTPPGQQFSLDLFVKARRHFYYTIVIQSIIYSIDTTCLLWQGTNPNFLPAFNLGFSDSILSILLNTGTHSITFVAQVSKGAYSFKETQTFNVSTVGINENEISIGLKNVYPNPSIGTFAIYFEKSFDLNTYSIFIQGILPQTVFEAKAEKQKANINLPASAKAGIYILEITEGINHVFKKLI